VDRTADQERASSSNHSDGPKPSSAAAHPDQEGHPYVIIFSLWLLVFAASSQIMIISPILPRIGEQLNIAPTLLGTLVTSYAVMVGICALITGPISDKIGRRKILLYGTGGMTLALAFHGLVFDYYSLLSARGLAGIAGGILSGSAVAYVGDYFPYEKRGWANGWIMSGIAMGQILGIPLGTILAEHFGFRMPFVAFAVVMGLAFILIFKSVPQPNVDLAEDKVTIKGSLRKYLDFLKRSDIAAASSSYLLMFLSMSVYLIFLPTWLEDTFNVTGNEIAGLFFAGGIANVLTGPQAGKLSDKLGRRGIILISCVGFAAVMIITTFVLQSFWMAYPLFFLAMVLIAMRISPFQALVTELVNADNRGALMSLMIAIGQVGYGLGGAVAGPAYAQAGYFSNTVIGAVLILAMAWVVWRYLPEPELNNTG
jgi:predicted MFS family arabinose efflux permease